MIGEERTLLIEDTQGKRFKGIREMREDLDQEIEDTKGIQERMTGKIVTDREHLLRSLLINPNLDHLLLLLPPRPLPQEPQATRAQI